MQTLVWSASGSTTYVIIIIMRYVGPVSQIQFLRFAADSNISIVNSEKFTRFISFLISIDLESKTRTLISILKSGLIFGINDFEREVKRIR